MESTSLLEEEETNLTCRFYPRGTCRYGDRCKFLHIDGSTSDVPSPPPPSQDMICKYFQLGSCYYGTACRFVHINEGDSDLFTPEVYEESFPGLEQNVAFTEDEAGIDDSLQRIAITEEHEDRNLEVPDDVSAITTDSENTLYPSSWVLAPEFVPINPPSCQPPCKDPVEDGPRSYARVLSDTAARPSDTGESGDEFPDEQNLCPFMLMGSCRYEEECVYIHGEICELCGIPCILPLNERHRMKHLEDCMREHEKDMEVSFAVALSREKACGVCMETVWEKVPVSKQRFGLLPNCSHVFCLDCIRSWRQTKQFENKIIRSCPECRVQSDFVCPSRYWVDSKEEKEKLIEDYKGALSNKACRYFKEGKGECPFGNKCFYLHAMPDGTRTDVGPPQHVRRQNAEGDVELVQYLFWDFLEERDNQLFLLEVAGLLDDGVSIVSGEDLSDNDWNSDL